MCELPTVYDADTPKARKIHECCECRGEIRPGENYHRFTGLWDGRWECYKTCIECEILRNEVTAATHDPEDHPPFGDLYEQIFEGAESNPEWVKTYMDTRRKRNAPESTKRWMEEIESTLANITVEARRDAVASDEC